MFKIKRTDEFSNWLDGLKDPITKQRLVGRLRKAMNGNLGDTQFVGEGVFEMRVLAGECIMCNVVMYCLSC
jgi:putative addiction module killer protein